NQVSIYLLQPKFGTLPEGVRLERIKSSPNYADGQFQNLVPIPQRVEGSSAASLWWEYLFTKKIRR
ncbi:MAG TPA: MBL fold metallo-hydrolase, partial [Firmicutes bacterium]|nr:MBL fold metallo-hydrolase [Bacillota bacterium]